jgi:integrase
MGSVTRLRKTTTPDLAAAVDRFLDERDLAPRSRVVYADTLTRMVADLDGVALGEVTTDEVTRHLDRRYGEVAPATFNRVRATIGSFFTFAAKRGWVPANPVDHVERRKDRPATAQMMKRQAVSYGELERLWTRKDVALRERTLWRMLFETAARANEILGLDVDDLDLGERSAWVQGKGVGAEQVWWATGTARLLPRLLDGRTGGPVFLTDRAASRPVAAADVDGSGRARLSYRRAAELFTELSGGLTLHQLRHSSITWYAEQGVDVAMLKAKSRHSSIRSLERYAKPSNASVARLTAELDPDTRRRRTRPS